MVDISSLLRKIAERPDQLQLFRYHDTGARKIITITKAEWQLIVELLENRLGK